MAVKTCLMIGAGGMAGGWINWFTKDFSDRIKIVGLVDVNKDILQKQGKNLGLSENQLFTDYRDAVEKVKADFCGIATPPQYHSPQAVAAMDHGMPVICEKPIADTMDSAKMMISASQRTGLPCAIIQNYRYAPNKQELVRIRKEGQLGRLQHIVGRYACDYRNYGAWGGWRHDMNFGLLFEGSVHHFDMLRFLSGGDCETLMGFGWNPEWSSFKHFSSGMYLMRMDNGIHTFYEGNSTASGILNCWHGEYYRAEFEKGTVELSHGSEMRIHRAGQDVEIYEAPAINLNGHVYLFAEFLDWLDGGKPSVTRIEDNVKSFVMVIAAVETTVEGQPKRIADYFIDLDL
ncbi:MAG: Gfo/Idh/MocA family oxidoreductase [Candidatus Poribacteria bacterium]|nr:Gfo/Idh/MocA family oxidoreductase [Candidatus Poribacteria bacterium]